MQKHGQILTNELLYKIVPFADCDLRTNNGVMR